MTAPDPEPEFGQRLPPEQSTGRTPPPAPPSASVPPRAARRMARGISFTLVMLGLLLAMGLTAVGLDGGWAAGIPLVLLGVAGFVAVQAQLHPALRDPSAAPLHHRSKLWLAPAALLLLGLASVCGSLAVAPALEGTGRADQVAEWVSVLVVSGMTLVVASALGFGLVAMAALTPRDDDDSPLRPTGYAAQLRHGRSPRGYYDSEWIRRPAHYGREDRGAGGAGGEIPGDGDQDSRDRSRGDEGNRNPGSRDSAA